MKGRELRGPCAALLPLLTALLATCVDHARAQDCAAQLRAAAGAGATTEWIDPATPDDACTAQLCTGDYAACNVDGPPLSTLQLVFSDEFETPGQAFGPAAGNPRWTAERMWYWVTEDIEVYLPEQVTTEGGAAVITVDRVAAGQPNATALAQRPDGAVWNASSAFKSGFVDSWNKFCFTGGYLEARLQLPGDEVVSGFWPALWLMGNLGRAGRAQSTAGMWPFTYDTCGGGDAGPTQQAISACPDPPGFDRTKFGLVPGQGRGAPEIDLVEVMVGSSRRLKPGQRPPDPKPGQQVYPHNLLTLQTAPPLPNGTTWTDEGKPGPGQYLPQDFLPEGMVTETAWWKGPFTEANDSQQTRPGSLYQDAVGAYASLEPSFWTAYHTFGLHWVPGQYIRWYIDGTLVYEVGSEALRAQTNSTGYTTYERLVPLEPMYIIFNLAMSNSFGYVDLEKLEFPSQYKVDYIRVFQNASAVNLGCSPKDFPTQQYLACNRDKYLLTEEDQGLVQGACLQAPSCRQEANVNFEGGDIPSGDGQTFVQPRQLGSARECCQACQAMPACGAYVYSTSQQTCFFKAPTGWTKAPVADQQWGALAGVVYDAGESWPRGTEGSGGPPPPAPDGSPSAPPQPPSGGSGVPPPAPDGDGAAPPPRPSSGSSAMPPPPDTDEASPAPPPAPSSGGARSGGVGGVCGLVAIALAALPGVLLASQPDDATTPWL